MNLKDSKTWVNLKAAFAGECEAHLKYLFYAKKARKEGLLLVAKFFEEAANQEKHHAKVWFKKLHNDDIPITKENLIDAMESEDYEAKTMYIEFAKTAEQEGFDDIANLFQLVAKVEDYHKAKYQGLLDDLEDKNFLKSSDPVLWICTECGHLHVGKEPPLICPICSHDQSYFIREDLF